VLDPGEQPADQAGALAEALYRRSRGDEVSFDLREWIEVAIEALTAEALAFRDAGRVPEAREWAAELVRLLNSHDLLT
jgi:hypothetical protein